MGTRHTFPYALCPPQALNIVQLFLFSGLNARQLEDPVSGANGLPRQQVPVPSQTPPPWLGICAGPSEGSDGKGRGPRST